ncbi:MAG: hypothetical protein Q8916_08615 [Bacteroidota bacterium]|nr:hypothetical protein [Bacteroidota bacterium]MDP4230448.1 hypothetical protein [Bacteroidota bacterium]
MKRIVFSITIAILVAGCEGTGFRKIEGANEKATIQSAQEALQQIELALGRYKETNRTYPRVTEAGLYDSLKNYFIIPIDPNHVYRNETDQSNFIAVGGRKNKIIYRYPATLGSGEYTLYWIGLNGLDEEGRGDDIFPSRGKLPKQLSRKLITNFRGDSLKTEFALSATGSDMTKDSVKFQIRVGSALTYFDWWSLNSYVAGRPELSEAERQEMINTEFDRFLHPVHFIPADSLMKDRKSFRFAQRIGDGTLRELAGKNLRVFTYYAGSKGPRAIFWNPRERRINVVSLSD